jgi:hypothetical protein
VKLPTLTLALTALLVAHLQAQIDPVPTGTPAGAPMPAEGLSVGPATKATKGTEMDQGLAMAAQLFQAFQGQATNNPLAALGGRNPMDFGELKAQLPEQIAGLRRTNARGQKTGLLGAEVSLAEGEYGGSGGPRLKAKITDLAGIGALGSFAGLAWMATEVDSEGDGGYERTTDYQGRKGLEKYDRTTRTGTATVVVRNRFLVEIEGSNVDGPQLKAAMDELDLSNLEKLASQPVSTVP